MNGAWTSYHRGFLAWLRMERRLSVNTLQAYGSDLEKLALWAESERDCSAPVRVDSEILRAYLRSIADSGLSERSQARALSSLRSFFIYLEGEIPGFTNPTESLEGPRLGRYLPEVLSPKEVQQIIDNIDRSQPEGERNKAIIELLFACGIRVSELTGLSFSDLFLKHDMIRVRGKGDKERLVPIGRSANKQLTIYIESVRKLQKATKQADDIVFLNRRGGKLSRQMIYIIVRKLAAEAGIRKKIGPHTFRHSFATALVNADASLRAVQEMLGHESITTTEIYTHLSRQKLEETLSKHHPRSGRARKSDNDD